MHVRTPAKINLFLEVLSRRPDGYHTIQTVFQTVSLYDRITILPQKACITLCCNRPDIPTDENNIALKAALLLQKELRVSVGARIYIEKHIPVGAGLGGGSSDAAAVLQTLPLFWKKKISQRKLSSLARSLGADVPFFLTGGTAFAGGVGEKLKKLPDLKPTWFVLIFPRVSVSTKWAYQNLNFPLTNKQKINKIMALLSKGATQERWGQHVFNRFEEPVFKKYAKIRRLKAYVNGLGFTALMSGSGSVVFVLVSSKAEGEKLRSSLRTCAVDTFVVQSVS